MQAPYPSRESGFYVVGLEIRTTNALEADPQTAKIPPLWQRFYAEDLESRVPRRLAKGHPFAVYFDYESDHSGAYSVLVGYQVPGLDDIPAGLSGVNVPGGRYLVFTTDPQSVAQTWAHVWEYFAQPGAPRRAYSHDYEEYRSPEEVRVYIAVRT